MVTFPLSSPSVATDRPPSPPPRHGGHPLVHKPSHDLAIEPQTSYKVMAKLPERIQLVSAQQPNWYKPLLSREAAISFVRGLDPGSFIVRSSTSVQGGYGLTMKISQEQVRLKKKMMKGILIIMIGFQIVINSYLIRVCMKTQ